MHYLHEAYVLKHPCTYLLTYTVGSGHIKPAICPKRLKIERKLLLTAYKVLHGLSIYAEMYDLEWPQRRMQRFFKCRESDKIQLGNEWLQSHVHCTVVWNALSPLGLRILRPCTYLLTYTVGSRRFTEYKTGNIPETVEDRAKVDWRPLYVYKCSTIDYIHFNT